MPYIQNQTEDQYPEDWSPRRRAPEPAKELTESDKNTFFRLVGGTDLYSNLSEAKKREIQAFFIENKENPHLKDEMYEIEDNLERFHRDISEVNILNLKLKIVEHFLSQTKEKGKEEQMAA